MMPVEVAVRSMFSLQPRGGSLTTTMPRQQHNSTDQSASASSSEASSDAARPAAPANEDELASSNVFRSGPLAAYMAFVWTMLLISYGISAPTGIFIPALAAGAAGGRLTGQLLRRAIRAAGVTLPVSGADDSRP